MLYFEKKLHLKVIQYVVTPSRVTILFLKSKFIFGVKILHQIIIDSISFAPPTVCQYLSSNSKRKKPSFYFQNLAPKCLYLYWPPAGLMRYINIYKKKFHDVICGGLKIATQVLFINFYDPLLWFLILKLVDLIYSKNKINKNCISYFQIFKKKMWEFLYDINKL